MYCYAPDHPCANKAGKVMEHTYVMYNHIGRKLTNEECVHHIDRDKKNNKIENLLLLTHEEHRHLHVKEDMGITYNNFICVTCGNTYILKSSSEQQFCSSSCFSLASRRFEVSPEELSILVWSMPTTDVAKLFSVSDVAVAKRCKKFGITKPPRGYWAKMYAK